MRSAEPFAAPVVDSLSVRVVVDSVFDQFMPKATHPMVKIEHVGRIRSKLNSTLAGEWGLSLHLESHSMGLAADIFSISVTRPRSWCEISTFSGSSPSGSTDSS
jgi:hypothetical protein